MYSWVCSLQDAIDTMNCLENVFKSSYLKGDRTPPTHNPDICALHASALTAWGLLLSIAPPGIVNDLIDRCVCISDLINKCVWIGDLIDRCVSMCMCEQVIS